MPERAIEIAKEILAFADSHLNGDVDKAVKLVNMGAGVIQVEHTLEDHRATVEYPKIMEELKKFMEHASEVEHA